jgi:sugar lactone lactonase YvrE
MAAALKAADSTVDFSQYTHVHMLHSNLPGGCGWAGLGSVGCATLSTPTKSNLKLGYVFQNVTSTYLLRVNTHEIGHNFGLGHSRSVEFPGEPLGPDRTRAIYSEYGDQFSSMGGNDAYHFAASHKAQLGWMHDGAEFQTVSSDTEADILPTESQDTGTKALRVKRHLSDPEWVWVEYRQPIGFDANMSPTGWNGALIHYQSAGTGIYAEVLDLSPRPAGAVRNSFGDVVLLPGRVWQDPYSDLTIEVVSATQQSLKVRVRYDKPCTVVTWPSNTTLGPDAGHIAPTSVSGSADCTMTSQGNNYWLTANAGGDFSLTENTTPSARSGSVTINRQTLLLNQFPHRIAPSIDYVTPSDGAVPQNTFAIFSVGITAPNGTALVGMVDVKVGDGCRFRFDYTKRVLLLFNDTGDGFVSGQLAVGSTSRLANSACTIVSPIFTSISATSLALGANVALSGVGDRAVSAAVSYAGDSAPQDLTSFGTLNVSAACQPNLSPRRFGLSGSGGTAFVAAIIGCPWTASSSDPWIRVDPSQGGGTNAQSITLTITVAPNDSAGPRSGSVRILDTVVAISQAGPGLPPTPSTQFTNAEVDLARTAGSGTIYFNSNLPESALQGQSDSDWLTVQSVSVLPVFGPVLQFAVSANLTGQRRVGSITIAGAPLFFSQEGGAPTGATDYQIQTIAGMRDIGDGGPAREAFLSNPGALAYDAAGNLYIAEQDYLRIRKVATDGAISTIAGSGVAGYTPDGAMALGSSLQSVRGLAVDGQGNIYFSELGTIRVIAPDGTLSTAATGLSSPYGLALDSMGALFIADFGANRVRKLGTDGKLTTVAGTGVAADSGDGGSASAARVNGPVAVAVDGSGNLFIAENGGSLIRKVTGDTITTIAGVTGKAGFTPDGAAAAQSTLSPLVALSLGQDGTPYFVENARVRKINGQGALVTVAGGGSSQKPDDGSQVLSTQTYAGFGLAITNDGRIQYSDTFFNVVRMVLTDQTIVRTAGRDPWMTVGDGGDPSAAQFFFPQGGAVGPDGSLYVADTRNHRIRHIRTDGGVETVAGTGVPIFSGDGGQATSATIRSPGGVAVDAAGVIYISDTGNARIRKIDTSGKITTLASGLSSPQQLAVDAQGNVYVAESSANRIRRISPTGVLAPFAGNGLSAFAGDGGQATSAAVRGPNGVVLDASGNLLIADTGNYRVRRVGSDGVIQTVAGDGLNLSGDSAVAMSASLGASYGLAAAPSGGFWIADTANSRILAVSPDGSIATIAGNESAGFVGDGGPAWAALLYQPQGVASDPSGRLYIMDTRNNCIRLLSR